MKNKYRNIQPLLIRRIAAAFMSGVAGALFGVAFYSFMLFHIKSTLIFIVSVIFFCILGYIAMRLLSLAFAWRTTRNPVRFRIHAAAGVLSILVVYLAYPLSLVWTVKGFHEGKEIIAATGFFFFVSLSLFLVLHRKYLALGVLIVVGFAVLSLGALKSRVIFMTQFTHLAQDYLLFDKTLITGIPRYDAGREVPGKPIYYRVQRKGHTRTGFLLDINSSIDTNVIIPSEGMLKFDIGVLYPGSDLCDARLVVMAKTMGGQVLKLSDEFIKRKKYSWTRHEADVSAISGQKAIIQLQIYSTDESHENLKPVCLSNMSLYSKDKSSGRNVIIVVLDALRADFISCYGNRDFNTPVLDRLASQGLLFENAVSASSWTVPSVTSILTSVMPSQHGAVSYVILKHDQNIITLPELLSERGVETRAGIANWIIYPSLNYDKGFNDFYLESFAHVLPWSTDSIMKKTAEWVNETENQPFFFYIHNMDPHNPYLAPGDNKFGPDKISNSEKASSWYSLLMSMPYIYGLDFGARNALSADDLDLMRSRYIGEVECVDSRLAIIERALKETGLWSNTLVIITSDHGEEFQEHGTLWHGKNLHRETIRVPLIFTGGSVAEYKGRDGMPKKISSCVSLLDLFPTVLEYYGFPVPGDIQGKSLWPLIKGEKIPEERMVISELLEGFNHEYLLMGALKGSYHLIKKVPLSNGGNTEISLYNWDDDPGETKNLYMIEHEKALEMDREMDSLFESLKGRKDIPSNSPERLDEAAARLKALGYIK